MSTFQPGDAGYKRTIPKGVGINNLFVNKNMVFDGSSDTMVDTVDMLRRKVGKFFVRSKNGTIFYPNKGESATIRVRESNDVISHRPTTYLEFEFSNPPHPEDEDGRARMKELAALIKTKTTFSDYYFQWIQPVGYALSTEMQKPGRMEVVNPRPTYRLYVPSYEKVVRNNPHISENVLPSFYAFYGEAIFRQTNLAKLNTLNGKAGLQRLSEGISGHFVEESDSNFYYTTTFTQREDRYTKYFNAYAEAVQSLSTTKKGLRTLERLATDYSVYTFTEAAIASGLLSSEAHKGEMFPFYNKIEFSTDRNSELADALWNSNLSQEIMKEVVYGNTSGPFSLGRSRQILTRSPLANTPPSEKYTYERTNLRSWELKRWVQSDFFSRSTMPGVVIEPNIPLANGQSAAGRGTDATLSQVAFGVTVENIATTYHRSIKRMFNGQLAYSEAVFYKIQKFAQNDLSKVISTYFIPNSSKLRECTFIDTQVKYGKKYAYSITAYVMVLGNEYQYNNFEMKSAMKANIGIGNVSKMMLFEIPISFLQNMVVLDNPPMPPETSIVSFKNVGNKVMINMNGSTGDREMRPVVLEAADIDNFILQMMSQRRFGGKIRFRSDDTPGSFQIFRTTKRPRSYDDFAGNKIATVSTRDADPYAGSPFASSAAFKDSVTPNVKYYYVIRSIDVHGNVSNPSPVYQMEMKTTTGPPYMDLRTTDFAEEDMSNKKPFKSMMRYVQIIPTTTQGLLNVEDSPQLQNITSAKDVRQVSLGVADAKLWGERFRIRFTSKKTGRKIDLDVNFGVEHQLKQS